jgi:hypothetical protein
MGKRGYSTLKRQVERRCKATNKAGQPCRSTSVDSSGYCAAHGGKVDMRELGSKGGRQSVRSRLGVDDSLADEALRRKAGRRLESLLDSPDESKRLSAARALYSYSAGRTQKALLEGEATERVERADLDAELRRWFDVAREFVPEERYEAFLDALEPLGDPDE